MLVCSLNIGTYRDAIGYRRHSCGVIIYNHIREEEQLKGTETPLITAGSFDWKTVSFFLYPNVSSQEKQFHMLAVLLEYEIVDFSLPKFTFIRVVHHFIWLLSQISLLLSFFLVFFPLWIATFHCGTQRRKGRNPTSPSLNPNQTAELVPEKWKQKSPSQTSDVIPTPWWLGKRLKE